MPFTSLAVKIYKDALTVQWANSIRANDSWIYDNMAIKAWGNFNGESASLTARASFNISSFTRDAAGKYLLTFTTNFSTSTYCLVGSSNTQLNPTSTASYGDSDILSPIRPTSGSVQLKIESDDGVARDNENINIMVIGPFTS